MKDDCMTNECCTCSSECEDGCKCSCKIGCDCKYENEN